MSASAGESSAHRPAELSLRRVRVARPTDRLAAVRHFYGDVLGLVEIDAFEDHEGYSGVMFGLPGADHHLEFTTHVDGSPGDAPGRDNLLVLYLDSSADVATVADRLAAHGHPPVRAENPYWDDVGAVTVEDPDAWRVVLVPGIP
jgi:catechol 2,3-dioxygenase-like lactoylglutathione lyase family enzyme